MKITRSCLIETAKRVFARCGYDGASIRTLAEEAHANVSAVSYHFDGKEGLYRAVIEPMAAKITRITEQTLKRPATAADFRARLELFVDQFFALQADEPEISQILQRDFPSANPVANDVFSRSFLPVGTALTDYFAQAQNDGLLSRAFDAEIAAAMLLQSLSGFCRFDVVRASVGLQPFLAQERLPRTVRSIVACFCDGVTFRSTHEK